MARSDNYNRRPQKSNLEHRINDKIRAEKVRLVVEGEGPKIVPLDEALKLAIDEGMDLVEVSSGQNPPVVKVMNYSKFKFEQQKKSREAKKKQKVFHVKEIKFRPATDAHDYEHKIKHAIKFLESGDKIKFTIVFRGREIVHLDLGFRVMDKLKEDLKDVCVIEKHPSKEGRNITMVVGPIGKKK